MADQITPTGSTPPDPSDRTDPVGRTDPADRTARYNDRNYTGWIIGAILVVLFVALIWWWAADWDQAGTDAPVAGPAVEPGYVEDQPLGADTQPETVVE